VARAGRRGARHLSAAPPRTKRGGIIDYETIEVHASNGVSVLWLNRPEVRNAFNETMIGEITSALDALDKDESVRVVAIAARGPAFCAGGDLAWSRRMGAGDQAANRRDALKMSRMFHRLHSMKKPTLARVHGKAYAGALGLIAACDIAIASHDAEFCLSEVNVGLAAATIVPYLLRSMGERHTRRYVVSAEVFSAAEAYRIGLLHDITVPEELDATVDRLLGQLLRGGPAAQATAKRLIDEVSARPLTSDLVERTASEFAALRASREGQEGIGAFLEKREPEWRTAKAKKAPAKPARKAARKKRGGR
jgi:methylglutaconyl-CoA hydratase